MEATDIYPDNIRSKLADALQQAGDVRKEAILKWAEVRDRDRKLATVLKKLYDEADDLPDVQKEARRALILQRRNQSCTAVAEAKAAIDRADADWIETHTMCVFYAGELRALSSR